MFTIESVPFGSYQANCYVLTSAGRALVVDPGAEAALLLHWLAGREVEGVVLTHSHSDHIGAANEVASAFGAPIMCGRADAAAMADPHLTGFDEEGSDYSIARIDRALTEGDLIEWGDDAVQVLETPGHTPGSICLWASGQGVLLTGDTLFAQGVGSTEYLRADPGALVRTAARLGALADEAELWPGHGGRSYLSVERARNPMLRAGLRGRQDGSDGAGGRESL